MQARYMLDTDTCIYLRKRRPAAVEQRFRSLQQGEVVMSLITYGELCNGALKCSAPDAALSNLQRLAQLLPVQTMTEDVALHYGEIRSSLEKSGQVIGGNDLWIAAHARALALILVTNNTAEFARMEGMQIESWLEGN
jgi:tRNA(fMet)-specific endonuclease VapC